MECDKIENNISLEDKYEELMRDFNMPIMNDRRIKYKKEILRKIYE